jgi:hypothetical protein
LQARLICIKNQELRGFMSLLLFLVLFFWAGNLSAGPLLTLNFENDEVGKFPSGWSSRDPENMVRVYSVQMDKGNKFLHADARGLSVQIGYEKKWELGEFPILRWRWRAQKFPEGTNEQKKSGNDSVLAVYVGFGGWLDPHAIKYIWSDTLPLGIIFDSPHSSKTKVIVVRSGRAQTEEWITEERNLLADSKKILAIREKPPLARGIAVLTDSDNTNSWAVGDYDDITISDTTGK